jgi:hypothetical protein
MTERADEAQTRLTTETGNHMLQVRNLSNVFQKRLIRPIYAQTQATPYAGTLDASLRNADGSFRAPLSGDANPTRTQNAFTLQGGIVPGLVMIKGAGDAFKVATGANNERPFGLLANFVGGTLDDIKDENQIGIWYGPGSVFELLAPAFDDTGLAAAYATASATAGAPVLLYANEKGQLAQATALAGGTATNKLPVAELQERTSAAKIVVKLLV